MVYPRGRLGADKPFCDVFDHDVDAAWLERIRTQIIALANLCLTEATVDIESNAAALGSAYRRQFTDNLYYDSLRLRPISDELIWKWSEATGKYIGCPYWSARAKALFDYELARRHDPRRYRSAATPRTNSLRRQLRRTSSSMAVAAILTGVCEGTPERSQLFRGAIHAGMVRDLRAGRRRSQESRCCRY